MIVISLVLVIAAAVSLFIGLFVATDTLVFIWGAIALCLVSLALLWLGTRQRKNAEPTGPSAPVYGGASRAGGSPTPVRANAPEGTMTSAAPDRSDDTASVDSAADASTDDAPSRGRAAAVSTTEGVASPPPRKKAVVRKVPVKKSAARPPVRESAAGTAGTDASAGTIRAAARARLAQIAGVGPAQQDALLDRYGSLDGIRDAAVDDIVANVRGFGEELATRVKRELG